MRRHTMKTVITIVWMAVLGTASGAWGQQFVPTGRDTLRGLPGVEVLVEDMPADIEGAGLTRVAIREETVRRLRAASIEVFQSQNENPSPAKAYVYIHVNALRVPETTGYSVSVQLHVRQTLRSVVTTSNVVNAMTWDAHDVLFVPRDQLPRLHDVIGEFVDRFVKDWRAVH